MQVRGVLINRNLSARSRAALLFIIDFTGANFILSGKLKDFYQNELEIENQVIPYTKGKIKCSLKSLLHYSL